MVKRDSDLVVRASPMRRNAQSIVRPVHGAVFALLVLAGCGDVARDAESRSNTWSTSTTTIGDTVVARTSGPVATTGSHQLAEVWRVGDPDALDSTITFGRVSAFAVNRDNTIAVFDPTGPTLRLYDASGRYVRTIGRNGAGPGEYASANGLAFLADGRLAIWDAPTSRITLFRETGEVDREWRPPVTGWSLSNAVSPVTEHALAIRAGIADTTRKDGNGLSRQRGAYFLYDSAGLVVDTLIWPAPSREPAMLVARSKSSMAMYSVPFTSGQPSTLLANGRLAVGEGDAYRIHVSGGATPLRIERAAAREQVNSAERDEQRAIVERNMTDIDSEWRWSGPQIPSVKPLLTALTGDADGRLWVRVSAPGEQIPEAERDTPRPSAPDAPPPIVRTWREPIWYDVFATDGRMLGRIVMPPRATWLGSRGDLVWGVVRDELDVPSIVQWRVTPAWGGQ